MAVYINVQMVFGSLQLKWSEYFLFSFFVCSRFTVRSREVRIQMPVNRPTLLLDSGKKLEVGRQ